MSKLALSPRLRVARIVCATLAGVALPAAASADCASVDAKIRAAISAGDRAQFQPLYEEVLGSSGCDSSYQTKAGRVLALAALKSIAAQAKASGKSPAIADLEAAARFSQAWQVMVPLGDSYYERKDWAKAFRAFEAALDDMRNEQLNPKAPPEKIERHAHKRAVQARALAPTFIASRSLRGAPSGVTAVKFRNFTAVSVPVPIRFQINQAHLTPDGQSAALEILSFLVAQGTKQVTLVGHTDEVGSHSYNHGLSIARAKTVKHFLLSKGYHGQIHVVGKGETQPFKADDRGKYSPNELYAMDRRVEFKLGH